MKNLKQCGDRGYGGRNLNMRNFIYDRATGKITVIDHGVSYEPNFGKSTMDPFDLVYREPLDRAASTSK